MRSGQQIKMLRVLNQITTGSMGNYTKIEFVCDGNDHAYSSDEINLCSMLNNILDKSKGRDLRILRISMVQVRLMDLSLTTREGSA